jgi:hypothetical protein
MKQLPCEFVAIWPVDFGTTFSPATRQILLFAFIFINLMGWHFMRVYLTFGERKSIGQRPPLAGRQVSSGIERFLQVVTLAMSETNLAAFASRLLMQNRQVVGVMTSAGRHGRQPDGRIVRMRMSQKERGSDRSGRHWC